MGPSPSAPDPKSKSKISQHDILEQSQKFILEEQLCEKTDEIFQSLRLVTAKLIIYGHRHLLDHIRNTPEKSRKIQFLNQWRSIHFENLDLLLQNLIYKKIMKGEDEQIFTKVPIHEKYSYLGEPRGQQFEEKGRELLNEGKGKDGAIIVGVIIFVGSSSTKVEETFNKQFYKGKPTDSCLFEIIMQRLKDIGDKHGFPPTYIFYNANNYSKITQFLKTYKYNNRITICLQSTHPILNINGNLCLKSNQHGDVIELPNGSGDFYHASIKGVNILQKLKLDKVEYISCVDCQNILQKVVDPYVVGFLSANKGIFDLMYKCTYPEDQRQVIFRRVVLKNGIPKADTLQALSSHMNNNPKYRIKNNQNLFSSPVWMNSVVFVLSNVSSVLQNANNVSSFPQTVNYTMKYMNYWSPTDNQWHQHEPCYVFQRQMSDLLINNLFRSQAIMVQRQEQYLPVITQKQEHSWESAYREYMSKKDKIISQKEIKDSFESPEKEQKNSEIAVQAQIEPTQ